MTAYSLTTPDNCIIRFRCYTAEAAQSVAAFEKVLPFSLAFYHARTSGQEV